MKRADIIPLVVVALFFLWVVFFYGPWLAHAFRDFQELRKMLP